MPAQPFPHFPVSITGFFLDYKGVTSRLDKFPGTSGMYFSSEVVVPEEKRGQGLGTEAHKARLLHLSRYSCNSLFCLVSRDNIPQLRILRRFGWTTMKTDASDTDGECSMLLCHVNPVEAVENMGLSESQAQALHIETKVQSFYNLSAEFTVKTKKNYRTQLIQNFTDMQFFKEGINPV